MFDNEEKKEITDIVLKIIDDNIDEIVKAKIALSLNKYIEDFEKIANEIRETMESNFSLLKSDKTYIELENIMSKIKNLKEELNNTQKMANKIDENLKFENFKLTDFLNGVSEKIKKKD